MCLASLAATPMKARGRGTNDSLQETTRNSGLQRNMQNYTELGKGDR